MRLPAWPVRCPSGRSTPTDRSPHPHLDSVLAERHADSGPSTTVLCPHSSHKSTPLPEEEPFTCSSPAPSRRLRPTRRTRGACATRASLRAAVHFPHGLERTYRQQPLARSRCLDLHVSLNSSSGGSLRISLPRSEVRQCRRWTGSACSWGHTGCVLLPRIEL